MPTAQIRDMYNEDFQSLDQGIQDRFRDKALKIADARGAVPPWRVFKPVRDVASNGLRQDPHVLAEDRKSMGLKVKSLLRNGGEWAVASAFGEGGAFGEAIVWRVRDRDGKTLAKIFLKRDKSENDDTSDKERRLLWDIHFSRNDHRYLPRLLGSSDSAPDTRGRTWLEYAIYGDFHHFLAYYVDNELVIPEPFAWYLLHCLAQALHFLEKGHNDRHNKAKHPSWTPKYHYDIKPGNILLDAPETDGPEWCRDYPKPILTDLGGAEDWPAMADTDQIPNHVRGGGTPRFSPFELFPHIVQYWSNKERTAGPARPGPAHPPAGFPIAVPPTISRRATPHKAALPENTHVRMHTSVHQVGAVLWCAMASRTSPAGQLFAWRGAGDGSGGAGEGNPYPAWWDRLPAHQPRRPWPWRVAKKGDREKYGALAERGWVRGQKVVVRGGGRRVRALPRGLDRVGVRPREWVAGAWEPYGPEEALRPAFSGRLVELEQ
ncbi:hypothetical protein SLS58_003788 [Diplodia intermedia]|uniref:Protein kinase domain-containing protein n=1 Tax=Diplodia intermedia TaxID=856260 RepID=A0ABR3TVC4_9PEZI